MWSETYAFWHFYEENPTETGGYCCDSKTNKGTLPGNDTSLSTVIAKHVLNRHQPLGIFNTLLLNARYRHSIDIRPKCGATPNTCMIKACISFTKHTSSTISKKGLSLKKKLKKKPNKFQRLLVSWSWKFIFSEGKQLEHRNWENCVFMDFSGINYENILYTFQTLPPVCKVVFTINFSFPGDRLMRVWEPTVELI